MIRSRTPFKGEAVARHYEDLDRFYRTLWGEHLHHGLWLSGQEDHALAVVQMSRFVAQQANIRPGMAVCDVGCGYGATARLLAQEYDAHVTALTVTPLQYEYAQSCSSTSNRPSYRLLDWLKNDFASGSFEAVIAIESTEHMADLDHCIAEASRVLQSGGRFVVLCVVVQRETTPLANPSSSRAHLS
jgi:tocopherol O-methyltransferase